MPYQSTPPRPDFPHIGRGPRIIQDWREYLTWSKPALIDILTQSSQELAELIREEGTIAAEEKRVKARGWAISQESTVTGRSKAADYEAMEISATLLELRSQIESLRIKLSLFNFILTGVIDGRQ